MNGTSICFALVALVYVASSGCTVANTALDSHRVPVEARQRNATRAALYAHLPPRDARGDDTVVAHTSTTRPAAAAAAVPTDADGWFVGIALSGGGSRSANFSAACLFQLQRLGLLRRADYISSVSGGSLTAAYYCAAPDEAWNPRDVQRRLSHSFATDLIVNTILPWNFLILTFSNWDRSDLLIDSFRKHLFTVNGRELRYADLRADRPRLLINATDLQSGKPFVFSNESFDQLNSDLSRYPLANAVAASAAVPVLLHHVTLRDYATVFKQYRHLVDGGVTDNLGIKTLADVYAAQVRAARDAREAGEPVDDPYPNGAVFFVIDARTQFDARLSDKPDIGLLETLATGAGLTSTVLINRASSATLAEIIVDHAPDDAPAGLLRRQKRTLEDNGYIQMTDQFGRPVYVVHLALSRLDDVTDLPFASFNESVNSIATYFNIDPTEAYQLYVAADLLVRERFEANLREVSDALDATTAATAASTRPAAVTAATAPAPAR